MGETQLCAHCTAGFPEEKTAAGWCFQSLLPFKQWPVDVAVVILVSRGYSWMAPASRESTKSAWDCVYVSVCMPMCVAATICCQ